MKASKDSVVEFHYTLSADGERVESSRDRAESMHVLLGRGALIPGMEAALHDHEAGDTFQIELPPEEAYGTYQEDHAQRVPKKYFRNGARLKPGMTAALTLKEGGQRVVTVKKVGMTTVDVDLNHPMAGKTLNFDIEVMDVREATAEELEHGHAHGPGAHAH